MDLLSVAEIMLSTSQKRLETVSRNISNTETSGHKRLVLFENILETAHSGSITSPPAAQAFATDVVMAQGALSLTDRPLDLAISGSGFFKMMDGGQIQLSRNGARSDVVDALRDHGQIAADS